MVKVRADASASPDDRGDQVAQGRLVGSFAEIDLDRPRAARLLEGGDSGLAGGIGFGEQIDEAAGRALLHREPGNDRR